MRRRYRLSLQTNNFIKEIITTTIVTVITPYITITDRNYVALYIIKKDITHKNILRRSKKSLKLNLGLLIKTSLANLTTNLINDLINIL
jgi:hypothetical protein